MNRNLNVFWGLVLCVGMIVGLTVLTHRSVSESDYGNPNEFYNSSSARTYSHVSSSAAVADGVGVPMRSTSSMRRGSSFVYAPAYTTPNSPIASSPNGPIASSPISYTSSSATAKSFGSGIGAGVSMSGGAVRSTGGSVSMSAGGGISGPISLPFREGTGVGINNLLASSPTSPITSSPVAITDPAAAAASYEGIGNTTIGGPRGMRGRQKGMPGFGDTWWNWLDAWVKDNGEDFGVGDMGGDGYYSGYELDRYDLQKAYDAFIADYWNSGMGTPPSFDEWLDWYQSAMSEGGYIFNGHKYNWLPIGNILPLLVFALLYIVALYLKTLTNQNSSIENK